MSMPRSLLLKRSPVLPLYIDHWRSDMIDTARIIEWLQKLVRIPSVAPAHAGSRPECSGEARIAAQLAEWFASLGAEVHQEEVFPDRPNLYGLWRATGQRWLAVDIHVDTVGVDQMIGDPFDGRVEDGRVYGRGAVDTKASLAIVLALLEHIRHNGAAPASNLLIAATCDEESGARGAPVFANWVQQQGIHIHQLMVAEPTLCTPIYGHKGSVGLEFMIEGVAAHSSKPQLGQNAIFAAAHMIQALEKEHQRLVAAPPETELGPPTLTVSLISGGAGLNVVPDKCRVSMERRLVAGESPDEIAEALIALADESCPLPVTSTRLHSLPAFYQAGDSEWIQKLTSLSGRAATVASYGTNAWAYNGLASETVIMGPGSIDQAHGKVEWVAISELEKMAGIYSKWWGIT